MRALSSVKPATAAFVLSLYFTIALNLAFWRRLYRVVSPVTTYDYAFVAAIAACLVLGLALFFGTLTAPGLFKPVVIVLLLGSAAATYFMIEYGIVIDHGMLINTIQTDPQEAADLLGFKFFIFLALFGVAPAYLVLKTQLTFGSVWQELRFRTVSGAAIAAMLALLIYVFAMNITSVFREHAILRHELVPFNYLSAIAKHVDHWQGHSNQKVVTKFGEDVRLGPSWNARTQKSIMVLVVGETARAQNFSLIGYDRLTNPKLATVPDLISLQDVTSCGTATAKSLPCMFSGLGRKGSTERTAHQQEGLLDILQRAGFSMLWRDNQSGCKGTCARIPTQSVMTPEPKKFYELAISYDDKLIDGLDTWIDQVKDRGVVVLHMMGNHGPAYYKRYPEAFERFKPACKETQFSRCTRQEIVNAYDNAIAYTDHVLYRLIELLKAYDARGVGMSMVYLSDHGESLGEKGVYLHGLPYALAPREQTHVPWLMWFSERFQASFKTTAACLEKQKQRALSHDHFFHSVLGLLDVATSAYNPQLDVSAACRKG
jgi:lipid A ethanolaminephosphotransferase